VAQPLPALRRAVRSAAALAGRQFNSNPKAPPFSIISVTITEEMAVPSQLASPSLRAAATIESINPATQVVNARFEVMQPADLPVIFERARNAQRDWAARPLRERCAMLRGLRDAICVRRDEIVDVVTREAGKPRVEAIFAEVLLAFDRADFLARQAPRWPRREPVPHHNIAMKAKSGWMEFSPLGVVAIVSPWNYPFSIPMAQVIPALVTGNAVLLKPSELTPWCGQLVGELVEQANFPPLLVQVLQGDGEICAAMIEAGPDKVFFTGSVATGKRIAEACAKKLIPSVLELGGKDAMIVLADADLNIASGAAVWGGFMNCGETCISVERIYAEQSIAEPFTQLCVTKTKKLRVGPASDPDVEIGPMIRLRQLEKVEAQLRDAVARGARILSGGVRRPDLGQNFLEPAVVAGVDHSMQLMREETFGPVIAIQSVANADEAVALANDSPFGLSASVWTSDAGRGQANCLTYSRRFRHDQRRRQLLRHHRGAARWSRRQRMGPYSLPAWTARNGSSKICGCGLVAASPQILVVRLHRRTGPRCGPLRRIAFRAELETAPSSGHRGTRCTRGSIPPR
jgi:acyl-CoA reductase-like NAD-dependent aldehyde dehydrogenase